MKKCRDCGIEKDYSEYFKSKGNADGFQTWCKKCHRIRMKKWEKDNPDKVKEFSDVGNYKRCKKNCKSCGKEYVSKSDGCSLTCRIIIAVKKNENGCWEWQKSCNARGYGQMNIQGKNKEMHRISYRVFNGPIPKGMNVLHKCDNRKCVNPDHLFLGTQKENIQDCINKGRFKIGGNQWKKRKIGSMAPSSTPEP